MNDGEIQIGGTYTAVDRQGKPVPVKVVGTKNVSSTRNKMRLQYQCERIDNGKPLLIKSCKQFKGKVGRQDDRHDSTGIRQEGQPVQEGLRAGGGLADEAPSVSLAPAEGQSVQQEAGSIPNGVGNRVVPPINVDKFRDDGRLEFILDPERQEDSVAVRWVWRTDCYRYAVSHHVCKMSGMDPDWAVWQQIDEACAKERLISRDHKSLKRALDALLTHHQEVFGSDFLPTCNRSELEKVTKELFHKTVPVGEPQDVPGAYNKEGVEAWAAAGRQPYQVGAPDFEEGEKIMKVKEKAGLDLMVALGYKATSVSQLKGRLERIEDHGQEYESLSPSHKRLFDSLRKVVAEGKGIEVVKEGTKGKKEKEKKVKESSRAKVMGKYSAGPFVRWLGRKGVSFEDAKDILKVNGVIHLSDPSIQWELKETREGKPPAKVSKEDSDSLRKDFPQAFKK